MSCHPSESWDPGFLAVSVVKALGPSFRWDDNTFAGMTAPRNDGFFLAIVYNRNIH